MSEDNSEHQQDNSGMNRRDENSSGSQVETGKGQSWLKPGKYISSHEIENSVRLKTLSDRTKLHAGRLFVSIRENICDGYPQLPNWTLLSPSFTLHWAPEVDLYNSHHLNPCPLSPEVTENPSESLEMENKMRILYPCFLHFSCGVTSGFPGTLAKGQNYFYCIPACQAISWRIPLPLKTYSW